MEDLISVIVPVYNSQNFLEECLNSIVNQTYKNLEIILVNDGSKDQSPEICKAFAEKDSRIKFFSKENGGQASARNFALDRITGRYVTFIDSDDWVRENYCSELYRLARDNNADITGCNEFNDEARVVGNLEGAMTVYSMQEYAELLIPDEVPSHLISKLFNSNLFNGIRFPDRVVEDMGIFPFLLKCAECVVISESPLYFYRCNPNGVSATTDKNPSGPMDRALIFIERYTLAADWVPDTMPVILKKAVWFGISAYTWFNRENAEKYSEGYEKIQKFFVTHEQEILSSPLIDRARKIAAKFIIKNHAWPFVIISSIRPAMKKIINLIQNKRS
ncbi:MAG: glycosyltransferase family 2 protein [Synergistaceae bacterium]|nr:glycosyltransferase family 2 protein [Synergistaceae bacterium]